jgi:IS30 family transposase
VANQLKMALIDTIQHLHQQDWSQRRIALELNIDRGTVARYLERLEASKPATQEGALSDAKPASARGALSDAKPATPEEAPSASTGKTKKP